MSPGAWRGATVVFAALGSTSVSAAEPAIPAEAAIHGVLRRSGDRMPLAGVSVLVYPAAADARRGQVADPQPTGEEPPWLRRVETDEEGAFAVDALPPGRLTVEVISPDYARARWVVDRDRAAAKRRGLQLFLRRDEASIYRTVVVRRRERAKIAEPAPVERQLSREELRTLPGSQGDPLRALQSLPGVGRAPFGAGLLVLRGANPRHSLVYVGDHPVPFAFHLSGLSSVLPPGAIEDLSFAPSNFAPAFGNASGGLVSIRPRAGRRDAYHGEGYLDLGGVGGLAEGPVGKGSFLVAARRAHLDLPLRAYGALTPSVPGIYPSYYDYQAFYDRPLGRGRHLHVGFIGAGDRLAFKGTSPSGKESDRVSYFEPRLSFHRLDLGYRARVGKTSVLITPAVRFDSNRVVLEQSPEDEIAPRRALLTTVRAQIDHALTESVTLTLGADGEFGRQTGSVVENSDARLTGVTGTSNTTSLNHAYVGLYAEAVFRHRGTMVAAGTRFSAFVAEGHDAFAVDPRLRLRQALGERWTLVGAVGTYTQPWIGQRAGYGQLGGFEVGQGTAFGTLVLPDQIKANFDPTLFYYELAMRPLRALQATAGASLHLEHAVEVEAHGFVRDLRDPHRPELYQSPGGLTYGGEFILRKRLTRRLYGWVAYTLMWAKREFATRDGDERVFGVSPYDQRHNLVAVLSLRLPRDWQIGGRFRLSSGLPYTPVVGAVGFGVEFEPLTGRLLSDRFPLFHQLDLRIDKRWVLDRTIVSAYLDVLNVYNHQNIEAYFYSVDFRRRTGGVSLPILPLIGVRVEI